MKNILCYIRKSYGTVIWENMKSFIQGFRECGVDVIVCDMDDYKSVEAVDELLQHPELIWFSVGFNGIGLTASPRQSEIDIPHVSVMLDVPYNRYVGGYDFPCRKHLVTYLDKRAGEILDIAYPSKNMNKMFMPLAGTQYDGLVEGADRKYDVVFSASRWQDGPAIRMWHDGTVNRQITYLLDEVADYMEVYPVTTVDAVREVLKIHGLVDVIYLERLLPYFWQVLQYIKMQRRYRALEMLVRNDIRVDVFGANWESVPFVNKLILHGPIPYEDNVKVFSQAKIVFQDQAEFNHGAHDRVFTAMLNGAVVVSEYSSYLEEEFVCGQEIFLYDWQNGDEQVKIIHKLLADNNWRISIAERARKIAEKRHCWHNRAEDIMCAVTLLYGENC